jgi:hypothetical protein
MSDGGREAYYQRVRPVVGDALLRRKLAVWDLGYGYLAAEALARTGLRRQLWLDGGQPPGGALVRSLGADLLAHRSRAEAVEARCREHNHHEDAWELSARTDDVGRLERLLADERPDLLLALGDRRGGEVAAAALRAGVPLVMTFVPRTSAAGAIQLAWLPGCAADPDAVVAACGELSRIPALDLDLPESHVDGLEARSMALALAKWILLRPDAAPRPDLEQPIVQQGRCLVVRGRPDWPWAVRFVDPADQIDHLRLLDAIHRGPPRYLPPLGLLRRQRLLVVGLGTASLFCAEAGLWARQMVFVDCKEVSPYNPVRQVYGTRHVGRPKPEALCELLGRRLDPGGSWTAADEGDLRTLTSGPWALGAARLQLRAADPDSEEQFARLLDQVQPTFAVVGMGRTRDDNFLATAELRRRGIRHVTPSAFPGVTHFKHLLTDGAEGPCYDCLQGHLAVDAGPGPVLSVEQREMFYGGTQPATLAETYPSAHSLLRLAIDLALPRGARPAYLLSELAAERACFVGANRAERAADGSWLYGADRPFSMVTYGPQDLALAGQDICSCGRRMG